MDKHLNQSLQDRNQQLACESKPLLQTKFSINAWQVASKLTSNKLLAIVPFRSHKIAPYLLIVEKHN